MKRGTILFLKSALVMMGIIVFSLCLTLLPWLAEHTVELNPEFAHLRYPVLFGLYSSAVPFFMALYQAFKLLQYIENRQAFSELAVVSLKLIKNYAIVIIFIYILGVLLLLVQNALHPGIAILGIIIIFASLTISFFAALLQGLLRNALEIKSENDLTV
ncbi:DUF2975 domain-containing protein [Rossellomorea aquimaris]|uniref:DUF2975 domain-containing protein n=1 Tax=Rossellomorea aquimaris TaxID=189382 RepID=UPI0007D09DF0|nr:DUF2975 domain-containing protein [Rossellomorea aquimaris]